MVPVAIIEVLEISLWRDGIYFKNFEQFFKWDHPVVEELVILDGCKDVRHMRRWFTEHYDLEGGLDAQVIRWQPNGGSR